MPFNINAKSCNQCSCISRPKESANNTNFRVRHQQSKKILQLQKKIAHIKHIVKENMESRTRIMIHEIVVDP